MLIKFGIHFASVLSRRIKMKRGVELKLKKSCLKSGAPLSEYDSMELEKKNIHSMDKKDIDKVWR